MQIITRTIEFPTKGYTDIIDLTPRIRQALADTGLREGQVTVFGVGSTTGISTVEYEPGLVGHDVKNMLAAGFWQCWQSFLQYLFFLELEVAHLLKKIAYYCTKLIIEKQTPPFLTCRCSLFVCLVPAIFRIHSAI